MSVTQTFVTFNDNSVTHYKLHAHSEQMKGFETIINNSGRRNLAKHHAQLRHYLKLFMKQLLFLSQSKILCLSCGIFYQWTLN